MSDFETDSNLLFGVIALQSDLIDVQQFVDGCTIWSSRKQETLAEVLIQQGWLEEEDAKHVNYLLERRLKKGKQTARQMLTAMPDAMKVALANIDNPSIHASLHGAESENVDAKTIVDPVAVQLRERLTLKGLHSSGGIGQVWRAYDELLGREIALKELKADTKRSGRNRDRFIREAQLTAQLEHPGIVPVYDFQFQKDEGRCYYTMRFVNGRTLTEAIREYHQHRRDNAMAESGVALIHLLNVFVNVCQTIAYAHAHGVIHRDLKGDNIILGDFGEAIVLDWGLAKRLDSPDQEPEIDHSGDTDLGQTIALENETLKSASMTMQGERLGTPAYMAPEQAAGRLEHIDTRTDVYGLAAILYEILTGEPPFAGKSIVQILDHVIHTAPQPPTERVSDIPVDLERMCLKGLSKDPTQRHRSAAELAKQIEGWIAERAQRKRTEQERERFFNLSLDLLAIINAQGMVTQSNPAWHSVLGWDDSEMKGRSIWQILHPDEHHRLTGELERILAGEPLTAMEHRCLCKSGTYRWVLFNANLISGEGMIYVVGRDITERKQSEQVFQELLESAPDAMVVINAAGQIVLVNAQLQKLFGYRRDELLGQRIEILVPEEFRERHPGHVARFFREADFRPMGSGLRLEGCRKDGTVFRAEVSLSPVKTEQGMLVSAAVRDVSQHVRE